MAHTGLNQLGRVMGYGAGVALVAVAVWKGLSGVDLERLVAAPRLPLLAMGVAVLATIGMGGLMFWVVTRSFDARPPVGLGRMTHLISASALLNYVPLRPGLIGRAVYLNRLHGLPLVHSVQIWLVVAGVSAVVFSVVILAVQIGPVGNPLIRVGGAAAALVLASTVTGAAAGRVLARRVDSGWSWALIKLAELLLWGLRLWLAMLVVGISISYPQAIAAAAAGNLAGLLPVTPNGLGLREWAIVGLLGLSGQVDIADAALATVIDRGVEVLVVVPVGLWSLHAVRCTLASPEHR